MNEKFLVQIEFRYSDVNFNKDGIACVSKTITIGIYDSFESACIAGNKKLEILEARYKLNLNYNKKERFSLTSGCCGSKQDLISNLGYLQTPFDFYAKITTLKNEAIESTLDDVENSIKRYKEFKKTLD
jgi:hypothetical protein